MAPPGNRETLTAVEGLRALPWELLRPSALVDFIQLLACGKPAVRLLVRGSGEGHLVESLSLWCRDRGLGLASDGEGFACVASDKERAARILDLDRRHEAHETELGLALGYPRCCCERVAAVGESGIDAYAAEVAGWPFAGPYRRINPGGYRRGLSLICHLPCSPTCGPSLEIADPAREFVLTCGTEPILTPLAHSPLVSE
ncbi:MAG: hypothetical protein M3416_00605 [Acidobacteriota bacterium]|nr:hypothetical protein [Acidobacteriota bacterium]